MMTADNGIPEFWETVLLKSDITAGERLKGISCCGFRPVMPMAHPPYLPRMPLLGTPYVSSV